MTDQEQQPAASPPLAAPAHDLDASVNSKLDGIVAQGLIAQNDIDHNITDQLKKLSPEDAVDALSKVENALRTSQVRNIPAYLAGVIKRVKQTPRDPAEIAAARLVPPAQAILDNLYAKNLIAQGDLDLRSLQNLANKSPDMQLLVMDTFKDRNLHGIRNMAAFFASHITAVERDGGRGGGGRGGPGRPDHRGPPPRGGRDDRRDTRDRYTRDRYDRSPDRDRGRDRFPPPDSDRYGPPRDRYSPPPAYYGAPPPAAQPSPYGAPPPGGQYGAPPQGPYGAPPPQQYAPPPGPQGHQPQYGAPPSGQYGAPPAGPAYVPAPVQQAPPVVATVAAGPKPYVSEHAQWGVRVEEFHGLSKWAKFVHPAPAFRLQQLWDVEQNKLVSLLTDASWEALAALDAGPAMATIDETVNSMKTAPDDLTTVNAIFMTAAGRHPKRLDAPTSATLEAPATAPVPMQSMVPPHLLAPPQSAPQPQYAAPPPQQVYIPAGAPPPQYVSAPPPGQYQQPQPQYHQPGPSPPRYGAPAPSPGPAPPPLPGSLGTLPFSVQEHIRGQLQRWSGMIKLSDFEERSVEMLHRMGEGEALRALDDFARNKPQAMRSVTAYLIGCLKKYDPASRGERERGGRGGGRGRGRGGRGGGGRGHHHPGDDDRSSPRNERYRPY